MLATPELRPAAVTNGKIERRISAATGRERLIANNAAPYRSRY
jgi:hypothetical protein